MASHQHQHYQPTHTPLSYTNQPLRIDASRFDRKEIADSIYPPVLPHPSTLPLITSRLDIFFILSITTLIIRAILGLIGSGGDSSITSLNSSIQLISYSTIWWLCYYMTRLYSPYFVNLYNQYVHGARQSLKNRWVDQTSPQSISSQTANQQQSIASASQPQSITPFSNIPTQFIINTDRKLTLFVFFIFNLLLFTLLVGLIEDFHGSHSAPGGKYPIKSFYDTRHPLHHVVPGHLDPQSVSHIVHPHKAMHTFLQLYPFHKNIVAATTAEAVTDPHQPAILGAKAGSLYIHTPDIQSYLKNTYQSHEEQHHHHEAHSDGDQEKPDGKPLGEDIIQTNPAENPNNKPSGLTEEEELLVQRHLEAEAQKLAIKQQLIDNEAKLSSILESTTTKSMSQFVHIATLFISFLVHVVFAILTYPYASHLISTTPILTYYSVKKPSSLIEKWYSGSHGVNRMVKSQNPSEQSKKSSKLTYNPRGIPKWSLKWFYHIIFPYQLGPPLTIWQTLLYKVINILDMAKIGITPTSLFDVTMLSLCYYIASFILMKDSVLLLTFFEAHYLKPFYSYYLINAPGISSGSPTFFQAFQLAPLLFMLSFTTLWLIKAIAFIFTLYWTVAATWAVVLTLLRSGVTSIGGNGGDSGMARGGFAKLDDTTILQIGRTLESLQQIYHQQYSILQKESDDGDLIQGKEQSSDQNGILSTSGSDLSPETRKKQQEILFKKQQLLIKQMSKLLFERLHVWKLSINISIVTLCLYYNDVIETSSLHGDSKSSSPASPGQHDTQHHPNLLPQWCVDVLRYIIHDNGSIGSGYNNSNVNNGKLTFAMLLQLPHNHNQNSQHHQ